MATKAKPAGRRLKVFRAAFGFHESVVAAPNQKAALAAWGVRQNLFAEGQAAVTTDKAAVEAALAHPEVPLSRAVGADGAFGLGPVTAPAAPKAAKRAKPRPDRGVLDAAERELSDLEQARQDERDAFERRLAALKAEAQAADQAWDKRLAAARRAAEAARRAYLKAGGRV